MLYGLVKCSNCGATLTRSAGNSVQCYKYAHGKCNVSHNISLAKLNAMVIEVLEGTLKGTIVPMYSEFAVTADNAQSKSADLIAAEKRKLERIKAAYEAGVDTLEEYRENKRKITNRINQLEIEQPKVKKRKPLKQCLDMIPQLLDPAIPEDEKNRLLRTIVDYVIFHRTTCTVEIFLR